MIRGPLGMTVVAIALVVAIISVNAQAGDKGVQWIDVPTVGGHALTAAVARPSGAGPFGAVVILHGVEGFRPHYVDLARALADAHFVGVAAAWFAGSRAPGRGAEFSDGLCCPR